MQVPDRGPSKGRAAPPGERWAQWGFPCCVRFPCVHAAATTPVQRTGALLAQTCPSVSAFPETTIGAVSTSSFSRIAQRSFTLRPAYSRGHQNRDRYPKASDISSPPCLPRLLPARAVAGWDLHPLEKCRLLTAHTRGRPSMPAHRIRLSGGLGVSAGLAGTRCPRTVRLHCGRQER